MKTGPVRRILTRQRRQVITLLPLILMFLVVAATATGLAGTVRAARLSLASIDDIKDKSVALMIGTTHDSYVSENWPAARILRYKSAPDVILAVRSGKAQAGIYTTETMKSIIHDDPSLALLGDVLFRVPVAVAFNQANDPLRESFNAFLQDITDQGILDDMKRRWVDESSLTMPDIPVSTENGTLNVGYASDKGLPFTIIKDGQPIGFDMELARRFAAASGKRLVLHDLEFSTLIASVVTGKVDMIVSTIMITPERAKQVDFSTPYYDLGASAFVLRANLAGAADNGNPAGPDSAGSFFASLKSSFYNNLILENRYRLILSGVQTTALLSLCAILLGTLLGALTCFLRLSHLRLIQDLARFYIAIIRGLPVLVLLLIIFYVVFASVSISPLLVAIITFSLHLSAYVAEMFRSAILSVDRGQREAGLAGGFSRAQAFVYIVMPQAIRQVWPIYKGELITLVKLTSIVGYIAVEDLTKAGDIIRSRTFDAFFPLLLVAGLYFALSGLLTGLLDQWARHYQRRRIQPGPGHLT